mgnify:CR=1 FL=1
MMSFSEHANEQAQLEEGIIRTGAITSYGAQSRKRGDEAVRAFKQGQQALKGGRDVALEDRVKRIEQALDYLFDGLIAQRQQIGAGIAVDVAGHTLTAKSAKKR